MSVDPTAIRLHATRNPLLDDAATFQEMLGERLRQTPWLMLSIAAHVIAVLLVWLIPAERMSTVEQMVSLAPPPPNAPPEPDVVPPPPEPTDPVETDDIVLDPTEITTEPNPSPEDFTEPNDTKESAYTSDAWASEVGLTGGAGGPSGQRSGRRGRFAKANPRTAETVDRALEWLRRHQDEDGKWDADGFMKHDVEGTPCTGPGNPVHDVGVTGLALLAFLGDGNTLRTGPHRDVVKKAVHWLRLQQDSGTGRIGTASSHSSIYDHVIATYAIVEAYGLSQSTMLRPVAQNALRYLEAHRNPYKVWRYQPRDNDNDSSVTGWGVLVYKSARDFGLDVSSTALKCIEAWFDEVTEPLTGRAGYTKRGEPSSRHVGDHATRFPVEKGEAMTGVGLMARFCLGQEPKHVPIMRAAADTLVKRPPIWNAADGSIDFYYWYYATYALYQFGGTHWAQWERTLWPAIGKTQRHEGNFLGSWDPIDVWGEDGGRVYATAINALTLQAYYRLTSLVR